MSVARRLAGNGTQPESLRRVETGGFQLAVVKGERFRLAIFQIEFAVIGAVKGVAHQRVDTRGVHARARKKQVIQPRRIRHRPTLRFSPPPL